MSQPAASRKHSLSPAPLGEGLIGRTAAGFPILILGNEVPESTLSQMAAYVSRP